MDLLRSPGRRKLLFAALYASEGAPIGYIWWALPTRLSDAGVPVERITLVTSILVLPWAFKFLWAPLVDALRTPRWTLRAWIVSAQLAMGLTLLPLIAIDPRTQFGTMFALLLVHALAAATQDVAIDALSIACVSPSERGALNGWMQFGMLLSRALFGGLALVVERTVGFGAVVAALVAATWFSSVLLVGAREPPALLADGRWRALGLALRSVAAGRQTWLALVFAGVSGAAFEGAGAVAGPYMRAQGVSTVAVGWFFAVAVPAGMAGGALLGGWLSDRVGRRRTVAVFLACVAAVVLALAALDAAFARTPPLALLVAYGALYFCVGLFTAASYALFMDMADPRLAATQFSALMGATNACEAWSAFAIGRISAAAGYAAAFAILSGASMMSLPLLRLLRANGRRG